MEIQLPTLTPRRIGYIAVGGAIGASVRWAITDEILDMGQSWPWAVFLVNVVGAFILGVALETARDDPREVTITIDGVGTGFCGGLTTMSTFAVEVAVFFRKGELLIPITYVLASVTAAVLAGYLGIALIRREWPRWSQ